MGIGDKAVISYLVTCYYSTGVLVPDALGILEDAKSDTKEEKENQVNQVSVLSRVSPPAATEDLAAMVAASLSNPECTAPRDLPGSVAGQSADDRSGTALYCPPAHRDDEALGEQVNDRLVDWVEQVGIYPGQLDRVRSANFGRLMMLTYPATDDPDRLLAAAKIGLAEWATDDHFLDDESIGADAKVIGSRLAITYAAVDPAVLPVHYEPQLNQALSEEPVAVAYRSAFDHLAQHATATQVARRRQQLAVTFLAYDHEAEWHTAGRIPPVWEYLTHRNHNGFLPPVVLVDALGGYEVPPFEFADPRVRRVCALAGSAGVILNDLYSMATESDADFNLPKVIAAEEQCSPQEATVRSVQVHNELMHTFVEEASVLSHLGSPTLRRFLADLWAWLGGNREWHRTTKRYSA